VLDRGHVSFGWTSGALDPDEDITARAARIETLAYDQLGELRLVTDASGVALTAADHRAQRWTVPLRQEERRACRRRSTWSISSWPARPHLERSRSAIG
jgi:hypothetical protein